MNNKEIKQALSKENLPLNFQTVSFLDFIRADLRTLTFKSGVISHNPRALNH